MIKTSRALSWHSLHLVHSGQVSSSHCNWMYTHWLYFLTCADVGFLQPLTCSPWTTVLKPFIKISVLSVDCNSFFFFSCNTEHFSESLSHLKLRVLSLICFSYIRLQESILVFVSLKIYYKLSNKNPQPSTVYVRVNSQD